MNVCVKLEQAQKPKPKNQRLTSVKPMPQKPFQNQGHFLDRFENVSQFKFENKAKRKQQVEVTLQGTCRSARCRR